MNTPGEREEFTRLLSKLFDQGLTAEEQARFEQTLEGDAGARRMYLEQVDLEVELGCVAAPAAPVVPMPAPERNQSWWWAAAAILVLGLIVFGLVRKANEPRMAELRPPVPRPVSALAPDTWDEDFEAGPPPGWRGLWVTNNLPPGSRGALASVTITNTEGVFHQVLAPEPWDPGLFSVRSNSHLRVVYRVEAPTWFNIFLGTLQAERGGQPFVMHEFASDRLWSEPGRWREAVIPLSAFRRKVDGVFTDTPPVPGEPGVHLLFSAQGNGLELTLDRLAITNDGPGEVRIINLPAAP
jgi:hypothetical protein